MPRRKQDPLKVECKRARKLVPEEEDDYVENKDDEIKNGNKESDNQVQVNPNKIVSLNNWFIISSFFQFAISTVQQFKFVQHHMNNGNEKP